MHTFKAKNGTMFIYNSDLSGFVKVRIKSSDERSTLLCKVDGDDLLEFVTEFIRGKRIERLEEMTTEELISD